MVLMHYDHATVLRLYRVTPERGGTSKNAFDWALLVPQDQVVVARQRRVPMVS